MIQTLPEDTVFDISRDLALFSHYFNELKLIDKLEYAENQTEHIIGMNTLNSDEYILMGK
jgi:hypothetical protein